jgi:hypothetical protein
MVTLSPIGIVGAALQGEYWVSLLFVGLSLFGFASLFDGVINHRKAAHKPWNVSPKVE